MHKIYSILKGIYLFKFFNSTCNCGYIYHSGDGNKEYYLNGEEYGAGEGYEYNHDFYYSYDYNKGDGFKEYYGDNNGSGYNYSNELEF